MNGSIYDFRLECPAFRQSPHAPAYPADAGLAPAAVVGRKTAGERRGSAKLVGLIANPRSHRNQGEAALGPSHSNVIGRAPETRAELHDVLAMFAERGIDILAIDGGDGTVRDVLTCAGEMWGAVWPDVLLLPTGKTNALAGDVGVPANWSLEDGLRAVEQGRTTVRCPLEIVPTAEDGVTVRGFIMGVGSFVDATALAQRTHRVGAFNGIAVGLALAWAIAQTLFGGRTSSWRSGSSMSIDYGPGASRMHGAMPEGRANRYMLFSSTLERLPIGLKPFGKPRPGLKTLVVDAPPRRLVAMLGPLLSGSQTAMLERHGYHRVDASSLAIDISSSFVLDGETFPAGSFEVREAPPLRFIIA